MLDKLISDSNAFYCVECRKCSSLCPVTRVYSKFSPASIIERCLIGIDDEILDSLDMWKCLSCGLCHEICPSGVDFMSFIRETRALARKHDNVGIATHEGVFDGVAELFARYETAGTWLENVKTDDASKVVYFAGCLPVFDIMFKKIGFDGKKIAENTVALLNACGVTPAVMTSCCGHDALWNGNTELFEALAQKNSDRLKKSGANTVVFSCPECYRTFKLDYPHSDMELLHISEFLADKQLPSRGDSSEYTFHDSCRLGRHLGIYDQPRDVLKKVGVEIREMEHARDMAVCCGTSTWMNCDWNSEQIRTERLEETQKIADVLITTCPKCQIHFKCTLSHTPMDIQIKDFTEVVAERLP